jgi:uncharacterized protein (DUF488 family)
VGAGARSGIPHLTPTLSAPGGGEGVLFTIGYEKARLPDFVATLTEAGIETLIDVRDRPISRRPGFSKRQLAAALAEAGIRYVGLTALGTPPEGREAGRRRDWDRFWHIVGRRLSSAEADLAFDEAAHTAGASPSCLLCYEADWRCCHRRRVAEILGERHGFTVRHLAVRDSEPGTSRSDAAK